MKVNSRELDPSQKSKLRLRLFVGKVPFEGSLIVLLQIHIGVS